MNELTISLLAIGLGLIFLLVLFNWWQERKIRKAAEKQFAFTQNDAPLASLDEQEPRIQDEFSISASDDDADFKISFKDDVEDIQKLTNDEQDNIAAISEVSSQSSANDTKCLPDGLSVEVDLIAILKLPSKQSGGDLRERFMPLFNLDKPVLAYGFSGDEAWCILSREQESSSFEKVAIGLQLADRAGAVSDDTLNNFQGMIEKISQDLSAETEWIGTQDAINFAKDLDAFCLDVDQLVNLHVMNGSGGRFMGSKFNSLAEAEHLTLKDDGIFYAKDQEGRTLFSVLNMEKMPFDHEMLKTTTLKGVTFQMDIARTPSCTETFNQMVAAAMQVMTALNGVLVDDHQRELSDTHVEKIRQQLKLIQVQMTVRGITPGTPLALRLFS